MLRLLRWSIQRLILSVYAIATEPKHPSSTTAMRLARRRKSRRRPGCPVRTALQIAPHERFQHDVVDASNPPNTRLTIIRYRKKERDQGRVYLYQLHAARMTFANRNRGGGVVRGSVVGGSFGREFRPPWLPPLPSFPPLFSLMRFRTSSPASYNRVLLPLPGHTRPVRSRGSRYIKSSRIPSGSVSDRLALDPGTANCAAHPMETTSHPVAAAWRGGGGGGRGGGAGGPCAGGLCVVEVGGGVGRVEGGVGGHVWGPFREQLPRRRAGPESRQVPSADLKVVVIVLPTLQ